MKKYRVEENLRCFNCGSDRVGSLYENTIDPYIKLNRATGKEESIENENYIVHHDCYICHSCKSWDFPDYELWHSPILVDGFTCECGCKRLRIIYNDILQDDFDVKCTECGKEYNLEKEKSKEDYTEYFDEW